MTTQDIYAWVQIGLQIVIGGGIIVGISRYFHILRRAIESQKATIEAQAEQMKAQSTVLQDVERLHKLMQQVIDFVDPQRQLQREQAFQVRLERETNHRLQEMATEVMQTNIFLAGISEAMVGTRNKLAETKSALTEITRERRERIEELERQLSIETESPQDS
jgi:hypothetical protein